MRTSFTRYAFIILAIVTAAMVMAGCSGGGKKPVNLETVSQPPPRAEIAPPHPPEEDIINDELPVMAVVEKKAPYLKYQQKRYNLDLQSGDVKDVLLALIRDTDIGLVIDPGVSGTIPVMDLKDATLEQILSYILPPLDLKYRWEGKNLHVYKDPLVTRYFKLDYLSSGREGKREVSFSTSSSVGGQSGGGGGSGSSGSGSSGGSGGSSGGGGQNQSSSEIKVDYQNTTWATFIESIKVLVFGSLENAEAAVSETSSEQGAGATGSQAAQAFALSGPGGRRLIIAPETGIVMVTAHKEEIDSVAQFIETFEGSAQRQVWIEAKIIEVNLFKAYQMGIDWGVVANRGGYYGIVDSKRTLTSPAMAFTPGDIENQSLGDAGTFQFAVSNNILDVMLDAISRQGDLNVLASPRLATLNNEKAVIRVVREEAFFNLQTQISQGIGGNVTAPTINVQVVPIGIVMDIIPQIGEDGAIMLSINPDISELLETRRFEVSGAMATQPVIDRRSIDTTARLRDGETLVIAGIIKERKSQVIKGIPLLYKLPLLGNLFRRTEQRVDRTELVILITPKLHSGRSARELTESERQRIKNAVNPMRLGDTFSIKEGIKGETSSFKKEKKKQNNR